MPSPPIQRRIAAILSAYDDLIENNLRRIKILEEMAQSLYREWFVKFRFPGHEKAPMVDSPLGKIPEGWSCAKLLDVADVHYGFPFKSDRFKSERTGTPVIRIRDIPNGETATLTDEHVDEKYVVSDGEILVGMDGDFHMTMWSDGRAYQNQRVARFISKGRIGNYHLFLALAGPIQLFNSTIVGTTVSHLGHSHIKTIQIAMPGNELLRDTILNLEPLAEMQLNLKKRNRVLRRTRDLLLPKLISGELDVSELDIKIPEEAA
jgi:type I restriction enzyme S subunit